MKYRLIRHVLKYIFFDNADPMTPLTRQQLLDPAPHLGTRFQAANKKIKVDDRSSFVLAGFTGNKRLKFVIDETWPAILYANHHSLLAVRSIFHMADALFDLLKTQHAVALGSLSNSQSAEFLNRLTSLSLDSLSSTEPASLSHDATSLSKSLQALSKRSYKPIDTAVQTLLPLQVALPRLASHAVLLDAALPNIEKHTVEFAQKYSKHADNDVLARRKDAMLLAENMERLTDLLELPSLLSSTISASSATNTGQTSSTYTGFASALDLHAHIKRLQRLYPTSNLIKSINGQSDDTIKEMTSNIVINLRSQSLKLAGAMRLVGLLRRVAPDLDDAQNDIGSWASGTNEGSLGALFLVSRLANLGLTLDALEPLKDLADQEVSRRDDTRAQDKPHDAWPRGHQTERYLKRYIENFREQCFAIISMYKSVFPASLQGPFTSSTKGENLFKLITPLDRPQSGHSKIVEDPLQSLPPALASFTFEIVDSLMDTLKRYLPNVYERGSRDSLLTQVLYCASSLGRLGGDFTIMLAELDEEFNPPTPEKIDLTSDFAAPEWAQLLVKHRTQANRLELLANGVGSPRKTIMNSTTKDMHFAS